MLRICFLLLLASVAVTPIQAVDTCEAGEGNCDDVSLVQISKGVNKRGDEGALVLGNGDKAETCGNLMNKGAYFAVNVGIGSPMDGTDKQVFELVADTGSDSVIVTSCVCVKQGFCGPTDRCFTGHNRSSSFIVKEMPINKSNASSEKSPLGVAMTFGSGTVMSIIASDVVTFAGQKATMDDGLLLMMDRRMLKIQGSFQGILGLGPPGMKGHAPAQEKNSTELAQAKKDGDLGKMDVSAKLFLQKAGVQRYSLCFNDGGKPGAMRVNVPEFKKPLPTIGAFHWGLGLYGISVGDEKADALLCDGKENMTAGQKTPCGAIPDSGTTLLMGPQDHIVKMFGALCDNWDRCKKAHADVKGNETNRSKSHTFQKLLYNCGDWRTDDKGIDEVPSIFFNVGEPGNQQKLELSAWSYIVETDEEQYKHSTRYLFGVVPVDVPKPTGKMKQVCYPNLGVQVFNTKDNGPVWIMGHPLFYQFNVGFDVGPTTKHVEQAKLNMAFTKEKCGSCSSDSAASLLEDERSDLPKKARPTRVQRDPPMVPTRNLVETWRPLANGVPQQLMAATI